MTADALSDDREEMLMRVGPTGLRGLSAAGVIQVALVRRLVWLALLIGVSGSVNAHAQNAAPGTVATPSNVIGVGDHLKITVFQNPDMTTETRVTDEGSITFPLVGIVPVVGLTTTQIEMRIAEALKRGKILVQPQVTVLVVQVRSRQVAVLGQVGRPGRYPMEEAANKLSSVLSTAGGSVGADTVTVMRMRNGSYQKIEVDIPELFLKGDMSRDIDIHHGDIVYVQRAPVFYIYGEAARPNAYRLERRMTIMQALALAGGLTPKGTERDIKVFRRGADDKMQQLVLGLQELVHPEDVIYIRQSLF